MPTVSWVVPVAAEVTDALVELLMRRDLPAFR
jgi:hypothetical protein